jgi:hypothetical protein
LSSAALVRAIELNGEAVAMNKAAFAWGRRAALDPAGQDERELWKRGGRGQSLQRRPHERSERQQSQAS